MKKLIITTTLILIFVGSVFAFNIERIAERLELTDKQQDNIEKIMLDSEKQAIDLKADLEKAQLELKELMSEDNIDRGAVESAVTTISDIQKNIKIHRMNAMFDARDQLTDEQKKEFKMHMRGMMGEGHHKGMRRDMGKGGCGMHDGGPSGCGMHSGQGTGADGCGMHSGAGAGKAGCGMHMNSGMGKGK